MQTILYHSKPCRHLHFRIFIYCTTIEGNRVIHRNIELPEYLLMVFSDIYPCSKFYTAKHKPLCICLLRCINWTKAKKEASNPRPLSLLLRQKSLTGPYNDPCDRRPCPCLTPSLDRDRLTRLAPCRIRIDVLSDG